MMQATKEIMLAGAIALFVVCAFSEPASAQGSFFARGACPTVQQPVCARKAGRNETYPNACLATRDKARVIAQERCPEFCSRIYVPVCGLTDRRRLQTYGNSCEAVLAGARVIRQRPCWLQR